MNYRQLKAEIKQLLGMNDACNVVSRIDVRTEDGALIYNSTRHYSLLTEFRFPYISAIKMGFGLLKCLQPIEANIRL
ncbi:hypothetical protein A6S26_05125 [Nostoc sp. ATCC 43529]|nr:hypothetical protein A6S26_05125 [Nostoc sp. ATCC 43529]